MDAAFLTSAPCWSAVSAFAHDVWACNIDPRAPPTIVGSVADWFFAAGATCARSLGVGIQHLPSADVEAVMARQCLLLKIHRVLLRQPLPLDTTGDRTEPMLQLLSSQGPDLELFAAKLLAASGAQRGNVVIGSAASGVGKTHLAYAWGVHHGFSIVSRVITSDHSARIAPPFAWLLTQLKCLENIQQVDADAVSAAAFLFVRLTLLAFVHFSVLALQALRISHPSATSDMQRQLLLRMHRNGNADALVTTILGSLLLKLRVKKWTARGSGDEIYALDEGKMLAYETSLCIAVLSVMGTDVLLTVDEAHELIERRECRNVASLFLSHRDDDITARAGVSFASASASAFMGMSATHSLFYAVVVELSSLQASHRWRVYVTGTALSMRRVALSSSASVATRCHPEEFAPSHRLTVFDIVSNLASYWNFDDVLRDSAVLQHLAGFVGRPQLFAQGVFEPILSLVRLKCRLPTVPELVAALQASFEQCVLMRKEFFIDKLERNFPVAKDGSGTQALIPMLFKAAVMDSGIVTLSAADQLSAAICTGLLAVSSTQVFGTVNMRDEPIIFEGIRAAVLDPVQEGRVLDVLLRSSQQLPVFEKGGALEIAISWHVALTSNRLADPSLADVLKTLGVLGTFIPPDLNSWVVRATRVHDDGLGLLSRAADPPTPFQRYFFKADGGIDDTCVVFNTPVALGADIAFLVSQKARAAIGNDAAGSDSDIIGDRQYKLVVLQCRNVKGATVAETLLTLHPGTQYLNNLARNRLLNLTQEHVDLATQPGTEWNKWHALALDEGKGFLTRNWVRIAVVARALDKGIAEFSLASATTNVSDKHVHAWSAAQRRAAALSPIIWVPLATEFAPCQGGFPESVRAAFVSPAADSSGASAATGGAKPHQFSRMTLRHHELWVPASVLDAAQFVAQIIALVPAVEAGKRKREAGSKNTGDEAQLTARKK